MSERVIGLLQSLPEGGGLWHRRVASGQAEVATEFVR